MVSATKIIGLAKLHKKLQRMPEVAKTHIRAEMEKAADEIVAMMKRLAPVLKEPHSKRRAGALRDSIGWTWGKKPKYAQAFVSLTSAMAGDLTLTIYAGNNEVRYAHFPEFGTQNMPASPYFFVSYRANRKRARSRIRRAVTKAAKEVASS